MKTGAAIALGIAVMAAIGAAIYMIDIDQTSEARLPDMDVQVESGKMPEFDANVGSITVTEEEATVTVPDMQNKMDQTEVTVPELQITPPQEAPDDRMASE